MGYWSSLLVKITKFAISTSSPSFRIDPSLPPNPTLVSLPRRLHAHFSIDPHDQEPPNPALSVSLPRLLRDPQAPPVPHSRAPPVAQR